MQREFFDGVRVERADDGGVRLRLWRHGQRREVAVALDEAASGELAAALSGEAMVPAADELARGARRAARADSGGGRRPRAGRQRQRAGSVRHGL